MKSVFFSLSLLLLLEKQAAGIGIYGETKGHFLVKTSPVVYFQKDHFQYGSRRAQEDGAEESSFEQTKHRVYGQDADADLGETQSSQQQTGVSEDIACNEEDEISQQKSRLQSHSQIKSQTQVKSHVAQVKSQTGQLKTLGQVKSQIKLKSHRAPLKSSQASQTLQEAFPQQIKGKAHALDEDQAQVRQQHKMVHRLKSRLGWAKRAAEFLPYFRQHFHGYDEYFVQFQGQLQGGIHPTKPFHQAQQTCYCPNGELILYQDAFTE
ncbi:seminal vesicle secretory protein 3A-like [Alexandromys fortis]|uniref:seminal vesicle secretory protein 3A-like n=1 Tax=Alexandromys fortis TaxID=100897 RepID=UPI0021536692|nr:seminal vesicle secretory protein 3A-like [Microtus fortis]XP_050007279.1 seminal vesicle secretory protein 3A-like [Microtus fortis]XP_050007280.1 seminal vesicle secretory protein 3A-like [Microtus fortis]